MRLFVCIFILFFAIFNNYGLNGNIYERPLTELERARMMELKNLDAGVVSDRFLRCSRNSIDGENINDEWRNLIYNVALTHSGRDILNFVVLKIEPFIECARSLQKISDILKEGNERSVRCLLNFFDELFSFSNMNELACKLRDIQTWFNNIFAVPRTFSGNISDEILTRLDIKLLPYFYANINMVNLMINNSIPLLVNKTFYLSKGNNEFLFSGNVVSVCFDIPTEVNSISGPRGYRMQLNTRKVLDSIFCRREIVPKEVCFIHELCHYIHNVIDRDVQIDLRIFLERLSEFLPERYINNAFEQTFTNYEEFRNITGLLISSAGTLQFDPCSEAYYILFNNMPLRCSHHHSYIPRAPLALLEKITQLTGINYNLTDNREVEYCESLNAW